MLHTEQCSNLKVRGTSRDFSRNVSSGEANSEAINSAVVGHVIRKVKDDPAQKVYKDCIEN